MLERIRPPTSFGMPGIRVRVSLVVEDDGEAGRDIFVA